MRLTPELIEATIAAEYYVTGEDAFKDCPRHPSLETLTICVLVLKNGFIVTGESNCLDPAEFDAEIGRKVARARAVQKAWELEGYAARWSFYRLQQEREKRTAVQR